MAPFFGIWYRTAVQQVASIAVARVVLDGHGYASLAVVAGFPIA